MTDLLIVGRGPSVRGFEFPDMPIMAVSSGIFAVPPDVRPPAHFVSMDVPKWFFAELHKPETDYAWQWDIHEPWPFWNNEHIQKHVPENLCRRGYYRELPGAVWDVIPEYAQDAFRRELLDNMHQFSFQPGWGDFSNVTQWEVKAWTAPNFSDDPIGMTGLGGEGTIRNSWFMAVQVAYRLGYRRLHFIGCDFSGAHYEAHRKRLVPWYELAQAAGMEWFSLSPDSALADVVPTGSGVMV